MKLFITIQALGLAILPLATWAQQATSQVKTADCVRDIKGDSVALYYDGRYRLTPIPCATFCRYTHLDPTGKLYGEVRDYRVATQQLAYRQHYANGVRQGSYEAFYPNGQLQMRGTFAQDVPTGEWQFWYASGKPWQVLRWDATAPQSWRYIAYWDSTGQQLLANGNGRWREVNPGQQRRLEGQVVNELPEGDWLFYHLAFDPTKPLAIETYEKGVFKKGRNLSKLGSGTYRDQPRLVPAFDDPSADGARFVRGSTCEEQAQAQAISGAIIRQASLASGRSEVAFARPAGDHRVYLAELLRKLSEMPSMRALLLNPMYSATVEADVDELGKLSNFRSLSPDIQRVFTQVLPPLGRWNAAIVSKKPVPSHVMFLLNVVDAQWNIRYQSAPTIVHEAQPAP